MSSKEKLKLAVEAIQTKLKDMIAVRDDIQKERQWLDDIDFFMMGLDQSLDEIQNALKDITQYMEQPGI